MNLLIAAYDSPFIVRFMMISEIENDKANLSNTSIGNLHKF